MKNIAKWINNPKRKYAEGLDIYHKHKLSNKHDAFFNTTEPTILHWNMLRSKIARIYQKLQSKPLVEEKKAPEPIKVKKINPAAKKNKGKKTKNKDKSSNPKVPKPEKIANTPPEKTLSVEEQRKNKKYINSLLALNWTDLAHHNKLVFNNDEKYFLEKKTLMIRNGDIEKEMRSLHTKMKAIDPDPKFDTEREEIISKLGVLDDEKSDNWAAIDKWEVPEPVVQTNETEVEKAAREAIEKEKKIKTNKIYIYRALKSLPKMPEETSAQKKRKASKLEKVEQRKQELIDLGHPYDEKNK